MRTAETCPKCSHSWLSHCIQCVSPEGVARLIEANGLSDLWFHDCDSIGDVVVKGVSLAFQCGSTTLTSIQFDDCNISLSGFTILGGVLRQNGSLSSLRVIQHGAALDGGVHSFAKGIESNMALKNLDLCFPPLLLFRPRRFLTPSPPTLGSRVLSFTGWN